MPTISGLLVILFAILPGVPADFIFQKLVGTNRKEEQWNTVIRMIGFSLGGLILYLLIGSKINAPLPIYISPSTFTNFILEQTLLLNISLALVGHFIGSIVIGGLAARLVLLMNWLSSSSNYPDAWDKFVRGYVGGHWVVIKLNSGESYSGFIEIADVSVEKNERDIILKEPAIYIKDKNNYLATTYQYLFLSGSSIVSIGVVSNPEDPRMSKVEAYIFPVEIKESSHARRKR